MTVVTFKPKGGGNGGEPPHIDVESQALLLCVLSDLVGIRDGEPDPLRADQLRAVTRALGSVIERFEPPKGAA